MLMFADSWLPDHSGPRADAGTTRDFGSSSAVESAAAASDMSSRREITSIVGARSACRNRTSSGKQDLLLRAIGAVSSCGMKRPSRTCSHLMLFLEGCECSGETAAP